MPCFSAAAVSVKGEFLISTIVDLEFQDIQG